MQSILVSACLLGRPVRYHGGDAECAHPVLRRWIAEGRVVAVCPEVAGGLPTPRAAAEIRAARGGHYLLRGEAVVIDATGRDVTGVRVPRAGVTAAHLREAGVRVFIEAQLEEAASYLAQLEAQAC